MPRPLGTILLAEDDANDVRLTQMMMQKCRILNPLHVVDDGDQAILYLQGSGIYSDNSRYPVPIVFLLDLRMPRVGGLDVLRWMRDHQEFAVNTFVLTAFQDLTLMNEVYQLGAKSFLTKPLHERDFTSLLCIQNGIGIARQNSRFTTLAAGVADPENAAIGR